METVRYTRRQRLLPGVAQFAGYDRRWARGDLVAGAAVAAYAVPQVVAYGEIAGVPAQVGLWSLAVAAVVYAAFGTSRHMSVGPESTTALMAATTLGPLAAGSADRYLSLIAALAFGVGAVALAARAARLGFLANLLSRPVLAGYMAGVAVLMVAGQVGKLTGVSLEHDQTLPRLVEWVGTWGSVHWPTLAVAAATLAVLVGCAVVAPRAPGPLLAVVGATLVVAVFDLTGDGVAVVGAVDGGMPRPQLGLLNGSDVGPLAWAALAVCAVSFSDNVLTARAFAARHGHRIDADTELVALGAANVAVGLVGGMPVSSSGSRTAIGDTAGASTQAFSVVVAAVAVTVAVAGGGVLASFPKAALGALVVYAAARLVDVRELVRLARFRSVEFLVAAVAAVGVAGFGVLPGIGIAVVLSAVELLARLSRPHDAVCGRVAGLAGLHDVDDHPAAVTVPGLVVYRFDGPLSYLNAEFFLGRCLEALDGEQVPVEWLVLNVEAVTELDTTAAASLAELAEVCARRDVTLAFARVKHDLMVQLDAAGLFGVLDRSRMYPTLPVMFEAWDQRAA